MISVSWRRLGRQLAIELVDVDRCYVLSRVRGSALQLVRRHRLTNNAVFALPSAGLVVRITRTHRLHARVHKVAKLGGWFSTAEAPTIRLADGIEQPVADGPLLATIWQYVHPNPPHPDATDLGEVLRAFQHLDLPPFELPRWDPIWRRPHPPGRC